MGCFREFGKEEKQNERRGNRQETGRPAVLKRMAKEGKRHKICFLSGVEEYLGKEKSHAETLMSSLHGSITAGPSALHLEVFLGVSS